MTVGLLKYDTDELIIEVSGIVDSGTAEEFSSRLRTIREEHPEGTVVLDMDKLTYISSAGLRAVLTIGKKENGNLRIINVSWSVMEVFEKTGFTDVFSISKKMREISVDGCEVIGKGANGEVYRLTDEMVVKLFSENALPNVVKRESDLSRKCIKYGIPTAISFEMVKCGNRYGNVYELLNAKTLSNVLKDDPSAFDTYAPQYVDLIRSLHSTEVIGDDLPSVKGIYYDYIDECADWYTPEQTDLLKRIIKSVPDRKTIIHGDYHANNIIVEDGKLMLIDMGDVSCGHPIFDFLCTASTQVNLLSLNPEYAEYHTKMPIAMIKKLWRYLIDEYFADKTESERNRIEEQISLFAKLKVAMAPAVAKGLTPEFTKACIDDAKENFLSLGEKLVGAVDW